MAQSSSGASVPRKEGRDKVTGKALYVDDLHFDGMIYGATVRSSVPRGRIKAIRFGNAPSGKPIPWHEFTVVTAVDIPGKNVIALILDDQPCLADKVVNHAEEAIVLLAHPDKYPLEEARRAVRRSKSIRCPRSSPWKSHSQRLRDLGHGQHPEEIDTEKATWTRHGKTRP